MSDDSQMVRYAGQALGSGVRVWWQVRVWDRDGQPSQFSEPAVFELGLLNKEDWSAEWTGFPAGWNGKALYFRKVFPVAKPVKRARVYISGLGCYELHLNGKKVGDSVLAPAWSTYAKRVYYNIYDIDSSIYTGENVIGVIIGNGWYGTPNLLLQLQVTYEDGSCDIVCASGAGWRVTHGPILANSLYGGETYDARLEMPGWTTPTFAPNKAVAWSGSDGRGWSWWEACPETAPPMRITRIITPVSFSEPKPQIYVFDMGQNFAGWVRLSVSGKPGEKVTLKFAESLYPDGTINQENLRSAAATDVYILKGEGDRRMGTPLHVSWIPLCAGRGISRRSHTRIALKAASYVRIMRQQAHLHPALNSSMLSTKWYRWTEISNEPSIPTDCPQRDERMGWLNDMAARSEQIVYNFDVARFLSKWISDIADTQDPHTGAITDTAPSVGDRDPLIR